MKRLIVLLLLTSNLLFSQNSISFIQAESFSYSEHEEDEVVMAITSFELVNGLPIVQAKVDGQKGSFILDTGAPGIVMNAKLNKSGVSLKAMSVGGEVKVEEVQLNRFQWGMIEHADIKGLSLDISHLEKACGRDLMGMIGFDVLKKYELFFDYKNKIIRMYSAKNAEDFRPKTSSIEMPIRMNGHVPVLAMKIGKRKVYLGLDSGAESNLLDSSFLEHVKSRGKKFDKERLIGLDQKVQLVEVREIDLAAKDEFRIDDARFLFLDLSPIQEQSEIWVDGILGFPFFVEHTVSINYRTKKMYIWN